MISKAYLIDENQPIMPDALSDILLMPSAATGNPKIVRLYRTLHELAFESAAQAIIITHPIANGNLLRANKAACKLLGYSKRDLLTRSRADIFEVHESSFKKMLRQRKAGGQSIALVTGVKKAANCLPAKLLCSFRK